MNHISRRKFLTILSSLSLSYPLLMVAASSEAKKPAEISDFPKYSPFFFGHVAKELEGLKLDFHVCEICGSTIDEAPKTPCDICNRPNLHYRKVNRPA